MHASEETPSPEAPPRHPRARTIARNAVRVAGTLAVLAVVLPGLVYAFPALAGADTGYHVLSGSMEPLLSPGDLVFVEAVDAEDVRVGDVLTFRSRAGDGIVITHRVVEVLEDGDRIRFITQGDANANPDPFVVTPETIIGRYAFQIPYWGLLAGALRTPAGYVLLVLVPGTTVILRESVRLYRELDAWDQARRSGGTRSTEE